MIQDQQLFNLFDLKSFSYLKISNICILNSIIEFFIIAVTYNIKKNTRIEISNIYSLGSNLTNFILIHNVHTIHIHNIILE